MFALALLLPLVAAGQTPAGVTSEQDLDRQQRRRLAAARREIAQARRMVLAAWPCPDCRGKGHHEIVRSGRTAADKWSETREVCVCEYCLGDGVACDDAFHAALAQFYVRRQAHAVDWPVRLESTPALGYQVLSRVQRASTAEAFNSYWYVHRSSAPGSAFVLIAEIVDACMHADPDWTLCLANPVLAGETSRDRFRLVLIIPDVRLGAVTADLGRFRASRWALVGFVADAGAYRDWLTRAKADVAGEDRETVRTAGRLADAAGQQGQVLIVDAARRVGPRGMLGRFDADRWDRRLARRGTSAAANRAGGR